MTDADFTGQPLELPPDSWLGGNARSFGRDGLAFYERCEQLGPLVHGRAYVFDFYVVTGPKLVEEILLKKAAAFHKPGLLRGLSPLFGDGLLTSDGDLWRHRRRHLQPVFHPRRNAMYGERVSESIENALRPWREDAVIDVHDAVSAVCLRNLTRALFGMDDLRLTDAVNDLATLCHEITQAAMSFSFPYYGLMAMFPSLLHVQFGPRLRRLEQTIIERVTDLHGGKQDDGFFSRLTGMNDVDGCPISKKGVRDELVTMFLAGHETVAAGVSWSLYLLARHPEVRRRLVEELDSVCGDALPRAEDLPNLPLLDKIVIETYRLYPPTHRIGRRVVDSVTIGGVPLDVGAQVLMPQWAIHRSARYYEAPHEFRPDRWTPEFLERVPRFAYFPFSGGPRVCIGESLAVMEHALVVAAIAKSFDFSPMTTAPLQPIEGLTLVPGDGFRLHMRRRAPGTAGKSRPPPRELSSQKARASAPAAEGGGDAGA